MVARARMTGANRATAMAATTATIAIMGTSATMTPIGNEDAIWQRRQHRPSHDNNNNINGGGWALLILQRQLQWGTWSSPGCCHGADGCVVMTPKYSYNLFPRGLTVHGKVKYFLLKIRSTTARLCCTLSHQANVDRHQHQTKARSWYSESSEDTSWASQRITWMLIILAMRQLFNMYYIQSHSQQRHCGGLGILIPSFLVLSFRSFQKR